VGERYAILALAAATVLAAGCRPVLYEPDMATRPYPQWIRQGETLQIQVLNDGDTMTLINATARSFENVDLWLNQRYLHHVDRIGAGETLRIPMSSFWDVRGEGPNPGGLLRYFQPTPIRLVQIQTDERSPFIGLVAVPMDRELDL